MSGTRTLDTTPPLIHRAPGKVPAEPGRPRVERREAWLLAALVAVGAALLSAWTLKIRQFGIQTDELLYVKLASSIADTLSPLPVVHGETYAQPTPAYPLLLAPLVGILPMPAMFYAAHALNCVLMASAAVPTYLLARAIGVLPRWAFLAAALAIVTPWITFSYFLTTESLAYPVMVWAVLAIHAAIVGKGVRADALAIAAIGLAVLTRTQFVALGAVFPVAVLAYALVEKRSSSAWQALQDAVRAHRLLFGLLAGGALVLAGALLLGAGSRVVGNYHSLLEGDLMVRETVGAVPEHLALLIVGASVIPFVIGAAWSLDVLFRRSRPRERAFVIVMTLTLVATVLLTAAFNRRELGDIVADRYAFYIVPLVGIAFSAGLQQAARLAPAAIVGGAALVFAVLARFPDATSNAFSVISPWYDVLNDAAADLGSIVGADGLMPVSVLRATAVLAAAGLFLCRRGDAWRRWGVATLGALVFISSAGQTVNVLDSNLTTLNAYPASQGELVARDLDRGNRDWVDDTVPGRAPVAMVPGVVGNFTETRWLWWDVESWNESVERSYDFTPGWVDTPFPHRTLRVDPATGRFEVDGEEPARYMVLPADDRRLAVVGRTLVLRPPLRLVQAEEPGRAAWWVRGTDRDGWSAAGEPVYVRLFPANGGAARLARVRIQLTSAPPVKQRRRFNVTGERRIKGIVPPGKQVTVSTRLCVPADSPVDARVRVGGRTELPTGRLVGLAVTGVRVTWMGVCKPA